MGTPLPPNEPGNDCTVCWGAGKRFGDNPTPKILTVTLHDLEPGVFWWDSLESLLYTPHLLIQTASTCVWYVEDEHFSWHVDFLLAKTSISITQIVNSAIVLASDKLGPCETNIPNEITAPAGVFAINGWASIGWDPEGLE